jgi:hypothetical protein
MLRQRRPQPVPITSPGDLASRSSPSRTAKKDHPGVQRRAKQNHGQSRWLGNGSDGTGSDSCNRRGVRWALGKRVDRCSAIRVQIDGRYAAVRIGGQQRRKSIGSVEGHRKRRACCPARAGNGGARQSQDEAETAAEGESLKGVVIHCAVIPSSPPRRSSACTRNTREFNDGFDRHHENQPEAPQTDGRLA